MSDVTRSTIAGLSTLGAFVVAIIFGIHATHGSPVKSRETVNAAFDNVAGLTVGDDVRVASVRVGYVEELRIQDGHAMAVLKLDHPDTKLYGNATAGVIDRSGFGQKFVSLDPGTADAGAFDGTIDRSSTARAQDINELFNVFDEKTRGAANSTLREFGGGMTGHAQDMNDLLGHAPGILSNTATVSEALTSRDSDLVGLMQSADTLSARFVGRQQHVADVLDQLAVTFGAMAVDGGEPMSDTIQAAPETLDDVKTALDDLRDPLENTGSAMDDLRPGAEALGKATPDLRAFMRDSVEPLEKLPEVNKLGVPALKSLTTLVHDARPLARQLVKTGDSGAPPVSVISHYVPEIVRYFNWLGSTLNYETPGGLYTRILTIASDESVGGKGTAIGLKRNAYVKPGQTDIGGH
jgi:phospholipid/cholesterol/gamma-HCH transport system substrate-binding protein